MVVLVGSQWAASSSNRFLGFQLFFFPENGSDAGRTYPPPVVPLRIEKRRAKSR